MHGRIYLDIKFLGYHFSALNLQSGAEEKSEDSLTVIHLQVTDFLWMSEGFFSLFLELGPLKTFPLCGH